MSKKSTSSATYSEVGVIGAGAWGTALALAAAQNCRKVALWAREVEVVEQIRTQRENARFLPGVQLPANISVSSAISDAAKAPAVLVVVPAQHLRTTLSDIARLVARNTPLVLCAKGMEKNSGKLVTEVLAEAIAHAHPAILSGPSFAADVARGLPTAVTIAARSLDVAQRLQHALGSASFRPYASDDITGVALGGAAKNVYAIGCGIVSGLGLGESARAGLLSRSFAELARFGEALGARRETLMGLAGLGDLVLTATSPTSRNFAFGHALGSGRPLAELTAPGRPLAEGVETAPALLARAKAQRVELPIAEAIAAMLAGTLAPKDAVMRLMSRPLTQE